MTDDGVTVQLERGELYVSLRSVDEIKEIVETSRTKCKYFYYYLVLE
jgi:hypothetical protein